MKKILLLLAASFILNNIQAQEAKEIAVKNMVELQRFTFVAEYAQPLKGGNIYLTSPYEMKITKDTVSAYLPYYGQGYTAPADPTKGAIDFTSLSFEYRIDKAKKDGWDISIKPKDAGDIQAVQLHISTSGQASLQVNSLNRTSISFLGYIKERTKR